MIPIEYYFDDKIFVIENEKIFQSNWQPLCFKGDLPNNNDFAIFRVGGVEVVIQNFQGLIKAFSNVCPHRFSCLQSGRMGNRVLQCPYHRLQFNHFGESINKPLGEDYPYTQLKLYEWHIDVCGQLVFVSFNKPSKSLKEYLGACFVYIENITNSIGEEIFVEEQLIEANWKLVIQNTIEFDHAFSVHPKTFAELVQKPLEILDLEAPSPLIHYRTRCKNLSREERFTQKIFKQFCNTTYFSDYPCYEHFYLFPLLTVGHCNGPVSFFRYTPISPSQTLLQIRVWSPKAVVENEDYAKLTLKLFPSIVDFIKKLSLEDKEICEAVFRGVMSAPKDMKMIFSKGDFLIEKFQESYLSFMK